jgi:hypothetical protein
MWIFMEGFAIDVETSKKKISEPWAYGASAGLAEACLAFSE